MFGAESGPNVPQEDTEKVQSLSSLEDEVTQRIDPADVREARIRAATKKRDEIWGRYNRINNERSQRDVPVEVQNKLRGEMDQLLKKGEELDQNIIQIESEPIAEAKGQDAAQEYVGLRTKLKRLKEDYGVVGDGETQAELGDDIRETEDRIAELEQGVDRAVA